MDVSKAPYHFRRYHGSVNKVAKNQRLESLAGSRQGNNLSIDDNAIGFTPSERCAVFLNDFDSDLLSSFKCQLCALQPNSLESFVVELSLFIGQFYLLFPAQCHVADSQIFGYRPLSSSRRSSSRPCLFLVVCFSLRLACCILHNISLRYYE
jgi:hypothetical protein